MFKMRDRPTATPLASSMAQRQAREITSRCQRTVCGTRPVAINRLSREESAALLCGGGIQGRNGVSMHRRLHSRARSICPTPSIRKYYARPDVDRTPARIARYAQRLYERGDLDAPLRMVMPKHDWDVMYETNRKKYYEYRYGPAFTAPVCLYCDNVHFGWYKRDELYDGVICDHCAQFATPSFRDQDIYLSLKRTISSKTNKKQCLPP